MAKRETFDLREAGREFGAQGHNQRTLAAWEHGVRRAVYGGDLLYQSSARDYADAAYCGWLYASNRIKRGDRFKCGECGELHGAKA